ncbi:MAG: UV damage endonuclease UvsE [Proteobacteria bacterium]|nr:UV damage endonuclease UvsE [Pseudomonadota bacterium]
MNKRIGFACKWIDSPDQVDGIKPKDDCKKYNTGSTTVAWLNRQSKDVAEQKLWDLVKGNIESTRLLVERVSKLNENLRMVRLSSDILPVYTEPTWSYFYRDNTVRQYCERHFSTIGNLARSSGIRLSFHPGQFTVLASDNEQIVERSIEEFEYHVDMARWMGYGKEFQDYKINVHIAGRAGPPGIRAALKRMSPEARNTITIENEEISYGLDDCLSISDVVPIVLDIHHFFIREGSYIQPRDDSVKRVIDSWRGVRPVCHYSVSREDLLVGHCANTLPNYAQLLESGHKRQKLRAHSDFYWNTAVNEWALGFLDSHDIMCESKAKNLASFRLFEEAEQLGLY